MKNKKKIFTTIIVLAAAVVIWLNLDSTQISNPRSYKDNEYKFKLDLPTNWTFTETNQMQSDNPRYLFWEQWWIVKQTEFTTKIDNFNPSIYIINQNIDNVIDKLKNQLNNNPFHPTLEQTEINGLVAYITSICDLGCCSKDVYVARDEYITLLISRGNICNTSDEKTQKTIDLESEFDHFLNTLEFVE